MENQAAELTASHHAHIWAPIVLNRPVRSERPLLKIVAFNARGGGCVEKIAKRLRLAPLKDPDVILLSEADWRLKRTGRREVAADLAAELEMSFAYIAEFGRTREDGVPAFSMGNAILSSRPLTDVNAVPMSRLFTRKRAWQLAGSPTGLTAKIILNRKPILLGIAHLNSRWNPAGRALQMSQYIQGVPREGVAIIGGDFNTTTLDLRSAGAWAKAAPRFLLTPRRFRNPQPWEPLFECLSEAGFDTCQANLPGRSTFTFTGAIPPFFRPKLDWIAVRGLKVAAGSAAVVPARMSVLSPRFSDHDFVMCIVQV